KTANNKIPSQWSPDGRFIIYEESDPKTKFDIWVAPVSDNGKSRGAPMQFLHSEFNEIQGQLSPDGRWMAYTSDESEHWDVYVRSFPDGDLRRKISVAGGLQPHWRADGRELFFVAPEGKVMAVPVRTGAGPKPSFETDAAVPLFENHIETSGVAVR